MRKNILKKLVVIGMSTIMLFGQTLSIQAATYTVSKPGFNRSTTNGGLTYKRIVTGGTTCSDSTPIRTYVWLKYHRSGEDREYKTSGKMVYGTYAVSATETTTFESDYIFTRAYNRGYYRDANYDYQGIDTTAIAIN